MGIFTTSGNGKNKWTRAQDEVLAQMLSEGKTRAEMSKATSHPENSISYRVRVLAKAEKALVDAGTKVTSVEQVLDTIKY